MLYLVETIPLPDVDGEDLVYPPTDLAGLAAYSANAEHGARWLTTFSPDLHDERHFSLWESPDADEIRMVMARFGFLTDGIVKIFAVRQWGPNDVLTDADTG
ncbi:MAG: hypothetical protein M3Y37_04215 [Chloroflexota bacterium]|nr:hypothetical protein [Chloroflexota bacterium]